MFTQHKKDGTYSNTISYHSTTFTETTVDLTWTASTDNVGVTAYDVYQNAVLIGSSNTSNYTVSGLTVNTTYAFTVEAKDASGNVSAASTAESVTTIDVTTPSIPTGLTAANITETSLDLSWTASTDNVGVTSYDVYQDAILLGNSTTTNYSVSGLSQNTTYFFYCTS